MTPEEIKALRELCEKAKDLDAGYVGLLKGLRWNDVSRSICRLLDENEKLRAELEAARRERDEARAVIAEPTEEEMRAYRASLTPEDEKRTAAIRELVVNPDLIDQLRAKAAALDAIEQWMAEDLREHYATLAPRVGGFLVKLNRAIDVPGVAQEDTLAAAIVAALEKARNAT